MRLAAKLGLVAAGLLVAAVGGRRGMRILSYYRQADERWHLDLLGFSATLRLGGYGCEVSALGMAAGTLNGPDYDFTPGIMNELARSVGAFSGALLELPQAAAAADLYAPEAERLRAGRGFSVDALRARIDYALGRGGLAIVNVDKSFTGTGEHFVLVHEKAGSAYLAADPALGRDTPLDVRTLSNPAVDWGGSSPVTYDVVGVAPIYSALRGVGAAA